MEAICQKYQVESHYIAQARTFLALETHILNKKIVEEDEKLENDEQQYKSELERIQFIHKEPLELLEKAYIDTLRQISVEELPEDIQFMKALEKVPGCTHPFVDKILQQLSKKNMSAGELIKAQAALDQLIMARERLHGEGSYHLLKPMSTVAQILRLQERNEEAMVIVMQTLNLVADLLREPRPFDEGEPATERP